MDYKKYLPHVIAIIIIIAVSMIYFSPVLSHKQLAQSDMMQYPGMAKALNDYEKTSGNKSEWTPNMFSGMPSYQIDYGHKGNIMESLYPVITLGDKTNSLGVFFLLALGFYVCCVCLGIPVWMSLFAGLMYALGSYNIIIIGVGHITKAWAMAMAAPVLAGMILAFQGKYTKGFILFTISLTLQLSFNHIQITYYTLMTAVILGLSYLIFAVKEKTFKQFSKAFVILLAGAAISLIPISGHLFVNNEYLKHTMRGGSELSIHPENSANQINKDGLDINYAFNWSYGKNETMTLLIPDYMGGGSADTRITEDNSKILSNRIQKLQSSSPQVQDRQTFNRLANSYLSSSYYGEQPFTAGPVYFGAIVVFLSLLGFLILDNKYRWWLLAATVLSVLLSWGSNFMSFNSWLFYHLPFFNKFRTPSMALVIANVTMCLAAVAGLKCFLESTDNKKKAISLYISMAVAGGITLLAAVFPSMFSDFTCSKDAVFEQQLGKDFLDALQQDRQDMFVSDARRSLLFILLAFLCLFFTMKGKIKQNIITVCLIGILAVIDLWGVDLRYVNKSSFRPKSEMMITPTQAINGIIQATEKENTGHFRVYNLANNPFNEATTSYFLPSVGGYSAAKLQRYQDIIDFYLANTSYTQKDLADTSLLRRNPMRQLYYQYKDMQGFPMPNFGVLNMLDTRYIILSENNFLENTEALGAAWFVDNIQWEDNADGEIKALDNFNPSKTAVINKEFSNTAKQINGRDTTAAINLVADPSGDITHLAYKTSSKTEQTAVFSEIYYKDSWHCFIDGKEVPYFRVNYILRGVNVPAGKHTVEFKCYSDILKKGNTMSYIGSVILVLAVAAAACLPYIRKKVKKEKQ